MTIHTISQAQTSSHPPGVPTLTLSQALDLALRHNRQIAISGLQVAQAHQQVAQARTQLLPQFDVQVRGGELLDTVSAHLPKGILGTVDNSPIPSHDIDVSTGQRISFNYLLTLAQPLTQIPRIQAGIRLQEVGTEIAREQERQQRQTITSQVRQAYYTIQQTQQGIAATNEELSALQELERTVANAVVQQTALRADLLDVQAHVASQEATLSAQLDTLQQDKEQMNVLLGRDIQTPFQIALETEVPPPDTDAQRLEAQALHDRPDLHRSALQIRQAELDRRNSQLGYIPDLSLSMSYFGLGSGINGLPDHIWTLGVQLTWQPFDWGRRRHEIEAKTQAIAQARLAYQEAQAEVQVDVNNQIRRERQARDQLRAAQAAQTAARERLRVTMNQYQVKAALLKDVLQAQAALADADRQVQDAGSAYLTAQAELRRALGEE